MRAHPNFPKNGVLKANAIRLNELRRQIKYAWARRHESDEKWQAWHESCRLYYESYDALAFPGGLERALSLLRKGDPTGIEMAVRYLEDDPWYYRSGYLKGEMIQRLRQFPLGKDQRLRLQKVVITRIQDHRTPREFRWYCRLAAHLADKDFEQEIAVLTESRYHNHALHARWVLARIKQAFQMKFSQERKPKMKIIKPIS
ncbi:MAG TPA: hypothetical protein VKZ53_31130 [Candidatus Angelobacter sp.]|nr:hypothetical protein [Candidatus Angelobacter sp.]